MSLPSAVFDVLVQLAKESSQALAEKLAETCGHSPSTPRELSSAPALVDSVREDPVYIQAMVGYWEQRANREQESSVGGEPPAQELLEQELLLRRKCSRELLELLRKWQANRIEVKLAEIQPLWSQDSWFANLSRLETVQILRAARLQHCLPILSAPPKISRSCPETFHEDLVIELPDKLGRFLNQHYPLVAMRSHAPLCPVEFYDDYFKEAISGSDVRMLQEVLGLVPTAILYTNITDYEVNFHVGFWGQQNSNVAIYPMPSWDWDAASQVLEKEGREGMERTQALRAIRQIVVKVHQLLAAFVADWYYLNINPVHEPQLCTEAMSRTLGGVPFSPEQLSAWVQPYIDTLQEIKEKQRQAYEREVIPLLAVSRAKSLQCTHTLTGHTDWVYAVAIAPNSQTLVSGGADNNVNIWNLASGKLTLTLTWHTQTVESVAISSDGETIVSGSSDNTINVWHLTTGELFHTLTGHSGRVSSVAISPDGQTIVSGSYDSTIKLWNITTGELIGTLTGHTDGVSSVAICPGGETIASGSYDNTIKLWSLARRKLMHTLTGHAHTIESLAMSPDGKSIASGSTDEAIKIWDLHTGELIRTLSGHSNWILCLAFSPDGHTLASGDRATYPGSYKDGVIKLWHLPAGELVQTLADHSNSIYALSFSPDGTKLVSGSVDNTIKVWQG